MTIASQPEDALPSTIAKPVVQRIGRYRVEQVLGQGGFGQVYLAYDEQLSRRVAVKAPHTRLIARAEDAQAYLEEARTLARLDHPHIVPVHDCGATNEFPCYVVSKFIDGSNLSVRQQQMPLTHREAAELAATVADALHYAHQQGIVHRDIKPANILLDATGKPFLADFGLALREQDVGKGPELAGTPAYMSPEQARGEGHRVDGRSDIFSLGVVFYELLTGRRPFKGQTQAEQLESICLQEPKPPRQCDDAIPKELERICLKALAKRASDRYTTAKDLAEDLRHWSAIADCGLRIAESDRKSQISDSSSVLNPQSKIQNPKSDSWPIRIVPKGLRSFDEHDASFFLELLPGPRDRDGLPDSLRFWKTRIEELDGDKTFAVGLVYGPSGCGKSSLVRAGLLPRLSPDVISIYLEASSEQTESRLLRELRKRCPNVAWDELASPTMLKDSLALLRRGQGLPGGKKLLIVLDQFEQWLHAHKEDADSLLVQALRQCDGGRVQCLVMVRDDFWLAVSRFLRELEIRLVDGQNCALADLFDLDHARRVLAAFGRAFGRLSEHAREWTAEEQAFLKQAVEGLSEEGKVVPVRLALFAEMMKSRPWTPASLREVGGATGLGATFLEETFGARTASPEHRYHQQAARAVLRALLPESGSNIKGNSRSHEELLQASGYSRRPDEFAHLLGMLDTELRLITPTDVVVDSLRESAEAAVAHPLAPSPNDDDGSVAAPSTRGASGLHYQLTHDYLVPSLRDWLTRKQRETRRGRAELRLAERSAHWNARPENRRLPALWEDLNIRLFTRHKSWTQPQRRMMRQAAIVYGMRGAVAAALLLTVIVAGVMLRNSLVTENDRTRAESLVEVELAAPAEGVPYAIENLQPLESLVVPLLKARFAENERDRTQRLHAALALAQFDLPEPDYLIDSIAWAGSGECPNIVAALRRNQAASVERLKQRFAQAADAAQRARLAIVLLHLGDASAAQNVAALSPDLSARTAFTLEMEKWHADVANYVEPLRATRDSTFRSALILAAGRIHDASQMAANAKLSPLLTDFYRHAPDLATHSACGWTLRRWQIELPEIPAGRAADRRPWFVNGQGQTMILIPAGTFQRKDQEGEAVEQTITLSRPFYLGDREVTIDQFQRFVDDPVYPADDKPQDWGGPDRDASPTGGHPVQNVNWYDAVLYCNWLSRIERLTACYERTGEKERGGAELHDAWRLVKDANGYRLPSEAQWEYACRAGTTTRFAHGDDESQLPAYAVFMQSSAHPCGSKLPNAWGLFDMHGNLWEWCCDGYERYSSDHSLEDPIGISRSPARVLRGGSWYRAAGYCRSAHRGSHSAEDRYNGMGFRVAVVP